MSTAAQLVILYAGIATYIGVCVWFDSRPRRRNR